MEYFFKKDQLIFWTLNICIFYNFFDMILQYYDYMVNGYITILWYYYIINGYHSGIDSLKNKAIKNEVEFWNQSSGISMPHFKMLFNLI